MSIDRSVDTLPYGRVAVTTEYLDELMQESRKLMVLESWGVDNWAGYDTAMSDLRKMEDDESE